MRSPAPYRHLEDRAIAEPDGPRDVGGVEQPDDLVHGQWVRERTRELRLHHADAGSRSIAPSRSRNRWNDLTEDSARATERALYGRSSSPQVDAEIDATNERIVDSVDVVGHDDVALRAESRVPAEIAAIRGERVGGEPAFDGEMVEVPIGPHHERLPHRPQAAQPGPSIRESSGVDDMPCASATPSFVT